MGYKDEKWREAPGYCVECDNLRPLNRGAVCEQCWNNWPGSDYEDWEEDEYSSHWYHNRLQETQVMIEPLAATREANSYIFVTMEGYTYQPDSEATEPDVENLQVLGFAEGTDAEDAFDRWVRESPQKLTFSEVLCYQLAPNARKSVKCFNIP